MPLTDAEGLGGGPRDSPLSLGWGQRSFLRTRRKQTEAILGSRNSQLPPSPPRGQQSGCDDISRKPEVSVADPGAGQELAELGGHRRRATSSALGQGSLEVNRAGWRWGL